MPHMKKYWRKKIREQSKKIIALLGPFYKKTPKLLLLFLFASLLDTLSIGLIIPYLDLVVNAKESKLFEVLKQFPFFENSIFLDSEKNIIFIGWIRKIF